MIIAKLATGETLMKVDRMDGRMQRWKENSVRISLKKIKKGLFLAPAFNRNLESGGVGHEKKFSSFVLYHSINLMSSG